MLCHGAAIAPRAASSTELVSDPNTLDSTFRERFERYYRTRRTKQELKDPLLELVRRDAILECAADRLVQLTDDFCNFDASKE